MNSGKAAVVFWKNFLGEVPRDERPKVSLISRGTSRGKVWLPEGPSVGQFPDNPQGFSTVIQTLCFKTKEDASRRVSLNIFRFSHMKVWLCPIQTLVFEMQIVGEDSAGWDQARFSSLQEQWYLIPYGDTQHSINKLKSNTCLGTCSIQIPWVTPGSSQKVQEVLLDRKPIFFIIFSS